jgi:hypothetical protein
MKKILSFLLILFITTQINAQNLKWADNSTHTLEKGRKEIGLFSPLKIGLKDSMELTVFPVWFFVLPNIELKKYWFTIAEMRIASNHKISYPTLLYNIVSKRGTGGILPETSVIPQMFKLNNSIMIGRDFSKYLNLTFTLGIDMCLSFGNSDFPDVEYHLIYPRTYSYNHLVTPYASADFTGDIIPNLYYNYDNTVFLFTDDNPGFIMEQKFKLQWNINNKWAMKAGTLFTYGDYPFGKGNAWYPIVDILYGF